MAEPVLRICTKCKQVLPLESFKDMKKGKYGKDSACRECRKAYMREYRQRPEVKKHNQSYFAERYSDQEYRKAQYLNAQKPERKAQKAKYKTRYRAANKERLAAYMREYIKDERVKQLRYEANRRSEQKNQEQRAARRKTENYREWMREWNKGRRQQPNINLCHRMSTRISRGLRDGKQGRSWTEFVNYSIEELIGHLEGLFHSGMSWENKGEWHIDHIRPIASFNFTSPTDPDFKKCWSLENLRPLWATDNLRKGAKMEELL